MGVTEYAAYRGVHLQAVQYAIQRGRIITNRDNLIDTEAADKAWAENSGTGQKPVDITQKRDNLRDGNDRERSTEPVPGISYSDARALKEVYEVQRKQLELDIKRGLLVRKDEVEAEAFRQFRILRDACFNLPPRLAAQLAAESDPATVEEFLEREIRRIFEDFSEGRT